MARKYRMTPARRAALRKAQAASARKRRKAAFKSGLRAAGSVAGTIAVSALVYHGTKLAKEPVSTVRGYKQDYHTVKGLFNKTSKVRVDPNAPGVRLAGNRKPLRYYGRGRASHIRGSHTGTRIRSRVRY